MSWSTSGLVQPTPKAETLSRTSCEVSRDRKMSLLAILVILSALTTLGIVVFGVITMIRGRDEVLQHMPRLGVSQPMTCATGLIARRGRVPDLYRSTVRHGV